MTSTLSQTLLSNIEGLKSRHPGIMHPNLKSPLLTIAVVLGAVSVFVIGFATLDVSWNRVIRGPAELISIVKLMFPPAYGSEQKLLLWAGSMGETLAISFTGTLLAALFAFPLGFLAARNVLPVWIARFVLRRSFDTMRGVDTLVWALIWINVVGLGPFAGVLAIMSSDFGAFGKLFSEAIEAASDGPVDGIRSTGGSLVHNVRFGLLPQVWPVMMSQVLYFFESNTRSATIIGIVGAGGIGLHLSEQIRTLEWQHVSFIVAMILVTVAAIDYVSSWLRFAVIGRRGAATSV